MSEPRISLIMTVLNEAEGLPRFLLSLGAQTVAPDEVVVVDGGSTDGTVALLEDWGRAQNVAVRVVVRPGCNISEGRNSAIALAQHELIAVTDAGTVLDADWLSALRGAWHPGVDVVAGFFEPVWTTTMERVLATTIMPLKSEIDPATFLPSSRSLLVTRKAVADVGGYPEWLDYCEDLVFDLALKSGGKEFAFAGDAIARWSARPSWKAYAKQYYRYARGDGKANLWRRRHALRYGAYAVGIAGIATRRPEVAAALTLGFAAYCSRYYRRVWARRSVGTVETAQALAAVPLVVVVGDVAKLAGYPVGVAWRRRQSTD